jgi:signal transduction histidine kinase
MVTSSSEHLLSLINDILDLSKVEAGKMELSPATFSLNDLFKNSLSFIVDTVTKHNIHLKSEISPDLGTIKADERRVKQVVFNLLSNAAKFTPDGGFITLKADVISTKSEMLPVKIKKSIHYREGVLVSVKDTGIGIAKKDQRNIFSEFYQVEDPYEKKYKGTGLGLALTKRLVELHDGKIWFESAGIGKGCTFYFLLPLTVQPKVKRGITVKQRSMKQAEST